MDPTRALAVTEKSLSYQQASVRDTALLGQLNERLIADEGHRNKMTASELQERMTAWLGNAYEATLILQEGTVIGYALYRFDGESVYLRQFYVGREHRRRGVGTRAISWLLAHVWHQTTRLRLDVLVGNQPAINFWRSLGFSDYCITMEREV